MDEHNDQYERRCPRLGGMVSFKYCRVCGEAGGPCWKAVDCWWESFDIVQYLRDNLPEETVAKLMAAKPKPKASQLVELIEQARARLKKRE